MRTSEFVVLLAFILESGRAVAGGMSSVGGDYVNDGDNPWFMGRANDSTPYCVERTEQFSLSADALARLVRDAFESWAISDAQLDLFSGQHVFPDGVTRRLVSHFSLVENCSQAKLHLLFGARLGDEAKPSYAVARAEREPFDRTTGSTPFGRITFAPDIGLERVAETPERMWSMTYGAPALYNVLLHELGHVMGISHRVYPNPAETMVRTLLSLPNGQPAVVTRTTPAEALTYLDPVVGWRRQGSWLLWFERSDLEDALGLLIPSSDTAIFLTVHSVERRTDTELRLAIELSDQRGWSMPLNAAVTVTRNSPTALASPVTAEYFNPGGGVFDAVQGVQFGRLYYVQTTFSGSMSLDRSTKVVPVTLTLGSGSFDRGTMIGLGLQTATGIVQGNSY